MDNETREKIALVRYKLISPVLAEPGRVQNEYFRTQAGKHHDFPRYGTRKVRVSTLKCWLKAYRKNGFEGLKPKIRSRSKKQKWVRQVLLYHKITIIPCHKFISHR